jgi:hypothetical protein
MRIEVEIDSEVYPELYARLSAVERAAFREERLRQLAATGLLWETVRLRGVARAIEPREPPRPEKQLPVLMDVVEAVKERGPPIAAAEDAPPLPPPLSTEVQPTTPKSKRVKRMLDRGLFKNG